MDESPTTVATIATGGLTISELFDQFSNYGINMYLDGDGVVHRTSQDKYYVEAGNWYNAETLSAFGLDQGYDGSGGTYITYQAAVTSTAWTGKTVSSELGLSHYVFKTIRVVDSEGVSSDLVFTNQDTIQDVIVRLGQHGIEAYMNEGYFCVKGGSREYITYMDTDLSDVLKLANSHGYEFQEWKNYYRNGFSSKE